MDEIKELMISELHDFKNHPFKVEQNMELFELTRSIEQEGVIVPLLARPNPYGDGYEIIAGHRRKIASLWAGRDTVPVVVRNLDDNQAVIAMVDSNLQRENIRLSEKAYAYKMKLEAMNRQGQRTESTSVQVEPKWSVDGIRSNELLAKQIGESVAQIKRYIRLTCLIPKILDMVDEGRIAFTIAVEQYELYAVMDLEQCTPSLSQANRLKRMSQSGQLEMDMMYEILGEEKANQREQIKIKADSLEQYFPSDYTPKQKVELIEKLVKEWHKEQQIINKSVRSGRIR